MKNGPPRRFTALLIVQLLLVACSATAHTPPVGSSWPEPKPALGPGLDKQGEFIQRQIAQYTGGQFVFLTYASAHDPASGPGHETVHDAKNYSVHAGPADREAGVTGVGEIGARQLSRDAWL